MKRTAFASIVVLLLSGCTLGPDYLRPNIQFRITTVDLSARLRLSPSPIFPGGNFSAIRCCRS